MNALITGASDGLGKEIALILAEKGYHIIAVARNKQKMQQNFLAIKQKTIISLDLSLPENCFKLYEMLKNQNIDIFINNAGYGIFSEFKNSDLQNELKMIDLNIKASHILMKLFLQDFIKNDKGYLLNISSIGAFFPSPFLSSYYGTKSYLLNLTLGVFEELQIMKSNVYLGVFCPATINTGFHKTAGITSKIKGSDAKNMAQYAIKKMFQKKCVIVPTYAKFITFFTSIFPKRIVLKFAYIMQLKKCKN